MPEPNNIPATPSSANNWMDNVPGGDVPFDDLFGSPDVPSTPAVVEPPQVAPPAPVVEPPTNYLSAGSTIYKTKEEAERGIAHKDEMLERLRNLEIQRTGIDPLTGKAVPTTPQGPVSYRNNQKAYFDDLVAAVNKQDPSKYYETQTKLVYDALEPIAPIIAEFTKQQAVATVSSEIKEFGSFLRSPEYTETLEQLPELRAAITYAEQDLNMASRLPQLYKTAFWATQGRKTPTLVANAVNGLAAQQPTIPTRPTATPTTPAPPSTPSAAMSLRTSEGRQAIIAQFGEKLKDTQW